MCVEKKPKTLESRGAITNDLWREKRMDTLKSRLSALRYDQPFGHESAPLVERLLDDLGDTMVRDYLVAYLGHDMREPGNTHTTAERVLVAKLAGILDVFVALVAYFP